MLTTKHIVYLKKKTMYRQEELSEIIDLQTNDFVHKPKGIERTALESIPEVENYATIITGIRR